ncbi:MAG TPA: helix-turn-helix domain-containing protein [Williamwhitmania sp.]|nr:helix-turn-helix domain-containing protein [Williamwhitmania sp.]
MILNTVRNDKVPALREFIDKVLPKHREYYLKENENANELDFLESLKEIYTIDLSDYIRIKGNDFFDDEIHKNKRIIEYLNNQIQQYKIGQLIMVSIRDKKDNKTQLSIDSSKRVLTLEEAATFTGFSKSYLYKLTSGGIIEFSKPNGKTIFFEREYLEKWMLSGKSKKKEDIEREALSYCTLTAWKGGHYGK